MYLGLDVGTSKIAAAALDCGAFEIVPLNGKTALPEVVDAVQKHTSKAIDGVVAATANKPDPAALEAIRSACRNAGLHLYQILPATTALALAYQHQVKATRNRKVVLCDIGAEAFNIAVANLNNGNECDILAADGVMHRRGERLDETTLASFDQMAAEVLQRSKISREELSRIVLVGGNSHLPAVQAWVERVFQKKPFTDLEKEPSLAKGAAIAAWNLGHPSEALVICRGVGEFDGTGKVEDKSSHTPPPSSIKKESVAAPKPEAPRPPTTASAAGQTTVATETKPARREVAVITKLGSSVVAKAKIFLSKILAKEVTPATASAPAQSVKSLLTSKTTLFFGLAGAIGGFLGYLVGEFLGRGEVWSLPFLLWGLLQGGFIGAVLGIAPGVLLRNFQRARKDFPRAFAAGMIAGVLSLAAGQWLFILTNFSHTGRILGWGLFGLGIGVLLGFVIPNLKKLYGFIGGAIGGIVGGAFFLGVSMIFSDVLGRGIGIPTVGFCIGIAMRLVETVLRRAWLDIDWGYRQRSDFSFNRDYCLIGTSPEADLRVFGADMAERHVEIKRDGKDFKLYNISHAANIHVNKATVEEKTLMDGDEISIDRVIMTFRKR